MKWRTCVLNVLAQTTCGTAILAPPQRCLQFGFALSRPCLTRAGGSAGFDAWVSRLSIRVAPNGTRRCATLRHLISTVHGAAAAGALQHNLRARTCVRLCALPLLKQALLPLSFNARAFCTRLLALVTSDIHKGLASRHHCNEVIQTRCWTRCRRCRCGGQRRGRRGINRRRGLL